MQINITTFAGRQERYIDQTLDTLFQSDWRDTDIPVNLIMGSADESHVQAYTAHPAIRIVPWDIESLGRTRWNCTLNKIRALRWGEDDTTVICEDDIRFRPNWLASLRAASAELENQEYVLSLFAAEHFLNDANFVPGKMLIKRYPTLTMQGAQAVYYPSKAIRHQVAEYLSTNLRRGCGDALIGQSARAFASLYSTKDVLVDHIGAVSCFPP